MKYAQIYKLRYDIEVSNPNGYTDHYEKGEKFISVPVTGQKGGYMSLWDGTVITFEQAHKTADRMKRRLFEKG